MVTKIQKRIRRAINRIERGWCKGSFRQNTGKRKYEYCLLGSIKDYNSRGKDITKYGVHQAVYNKLKQLCGDFPWRFNDDKDTTKEKVIAVLEEAYNHFGDSNAY